LGGSGPPDTPLAPPLVPIQNNGPTFFNDFSNLQACSKLFRADVVYVRQFNRLGTIFIKICRL